MFCVDFNEELEIFKSMSVECVELKSRFIDFYTENDINNKKKRQKLRIFRVKSSKQFQRERNFRNASKKGDHFRMSSVCGHLMPLLNALFNCKQFILAAHVNTVELQSPLFAS